MAASSPASSGKAASDSSAPPPAPSPVVSNGNGTPQKPPPTAGFDMPKPNLRGLNKPKCIQCGNVARSRCPFQCCKSCCYKAQNPCHIHVLKQSNTLPEKTLPAPIPLSDQPSTNSPLTGSASRLSSLQKLPHHFLNSIRTRKSLAKKDIASINKWRFMKLKEHMQGDIDVENEAYDRYTQNIGLLEETFYLKEDSGGEHETEATNSEEMMEIMVSEAKVRLKSDCANAAGFKERIATVLDQKLKKLQERNSAYEDDNSSDQNLDDHKKLVKLNIKQQTARNAKTNELLGKLTKAQSEDDLKPCLNIMAQLFGKETASSSMSTSNKSSDQESTPATAPSYSFPKLTTRVEVDENMMSKINEFSSLSQVVQL
ncbi:hypothetical protein D1007_07232 [Hordeum vulgare]|uniref:Predicted protein n=1 Tax=Hordeum vulgare subsp. vulgare TaxID=112509 RepID=F2E1A5_HORVV|nr:uncharacterized protein LOC123410647 [Hordeum vulgare subsp. vulgare]KAE8815386.1 hypothetical protein D1007_07232 [Hordeum vulgare]BAK01127.1 predicted protein [Hordeum vulgare subsp. vulgare]